MIIKAGASNSAHCPFGSSFQTTRAWRGTNPYRWLTTGHYTGLVTIQRASLVGMTTTYIKFLMIYNLE